MKPMPPSQHGRPAVIVDIRGTLYPSVRAASEALNVSCSTIYMALELGRPDTIGIGRGNGQRRRQRPKKEILSGALFTDPKKAANFACPIGGRRGSTSPDCSVILAREHLIMRSHNASISEP